MQGIWKCGCASVVLVCCVVCRRCSPQWGGQHVCGVGCGRGHGPSGATGVARTRSASDGGCGRL
eukprot:scaffold214301_cov43-Tisochrysis_lutea.AAC.1